MRSRVLFFAFVGLILVGSACQPEEDSAGSSGGAAAAETTVNPGTSLNPEQISSCVEQANFGAFTGDPVWTQFWNDAGQTDAGVEDACISLGTADPAHLQSIHEEWGRVQAFLAAPAQPVAPTPAAVPAAPVQPASPKAYRTCVEAIAADGGNYRKGIDAQYGFYDDRDGDGIVCEHN